METMAKQAVFEQRSREGHCDITTRGTPAGPISRTVICATVERYEVLENLSVLQAELKQMQEDSKASDGASCRCINPNQTTIPTPRRTRRPRPKSALWTMPDVSTCPRWQVGDERCIHLSNTPSHFQHGQQRHLRHEQEVSINITLDSSSSPCHDEHFCIRLSQAHPTTRRRGTLKT
jgi:hypothetical protein